MSNNNDNPKTYSIVSAPNTLGYLIKWDNGGQLPKQLKGLWMSHRDAKAAISSYEALTRKNTQKRTISSKEDTGNAHKETNSRAKKL